MIYGIDLNACKSQSHHDFRELLKRSKKWKMQKIIISLFSWNDVDLVFFLSSSLSLPSKCVGKDYIMESNKGRRKKIFYSEMEKKHVYTWIQKKKKKLTPILYGIVFLFLISIWRWISLNQKKMQMKWDTFFLE